jgi:hypothetical protein
MIESRVSLVPLQRHRVRVALGENADSSPPSRAWVTVSGIRWGLASPGPSHPHSQSRSVVVQAAELLRPKPVPRHHRERPAAADPRLHAHSAQAVRQLRGAPVQLSKSEQSPTPPHTHPGLLCSLRPEFAIGGGGPALAVPLRHRIVWRWLRHPLAMRQRVKRRGGTVAACPP